MSRVIIIDERKGGLKADKSNMELLAGTFNAFEDSDVVIRIAPDGQATVREPLDAQESVVVIRVKGEPEVSLEEAKEQRAAREHGVGSRPSDSPSAVDRFKGMWTAGQGEDDTGQSAGDLFR